MPWLTEFGPFIAAGARAAAVAPPSDAALARLASGDPAGLAEVFPGGVTVDDPRAGRVEGQAGLRNLIAASRAWLAEHRARVHPVATTMATARSVAEFDLELSRDGNAIVLPLAVVVEPGDAGERLAIRVYHSLWPLTGAHRVRPPLLAGDPSLNAADVVGRYLDALDAGDAAGCVATFEPDGCFREPAGPQYRRCGTETLLEFYSLFFSVGGGIVLEHCSVTEDGVRSALEFNAVRWGRHALPPQAGIAIYERGATGRIANARVYDDVTPPMEE